MQKHYIVFTLKNFKEKKNNIIYFHMKASFDDLNTYNWLIHFTVLSLKVHLKVQYNRLKNYYKCF